MTCRQSRPTWSPPTPTPNRRGYLCPAHDPATCSRDLGPGCIARGMTCTMFAPRIHARRVAHCRRADRRAGIARGSRFSSPRGRRRTKRRPCIAQGPQQRAGDVLHRLRQWGLHESLTTWWPSGSPRPTSTSRRRAASVSLAPGLGRHAGVPDCAGDPTQTRYYFRPYRCRPTPGRAASLPIRAATHLAGHHRARAPRTVRRRRHDRPRPRPLRRRRRVGRGVRAARGGPQRRARIRHPCLRAPTLLLSSSS